MSGALEASSHEVPSSRQCRPGTAQAHRLLSLSVAPNRRSVGAALACIARQHERVAKDAGHIVSPFSTIGSPETAFQRCAEAPSFLRKRVFLAQGRQNILGSCAPDPPRRAHCAEKLSWPHSIPKWYTLARRDPRPSCLRRHGSQRSRCTRIARAAALAATPVTRAHARS